MKEKIIYLIRHSEKFDRQKLKTKNNDEEIIYGEKLVLSVRGEEKAKNLETLLGKTLTDVNQISENVAETSAAMEEISGSITRLHENVDVVVNGYNDINDITASLVEASK